jgi:hypothetical protein
VLDRKASLLKFAAAQKNVSVDVCDMSKPMMRLSESGSNLQDKAAFQIWKVVLTNLNVCRRKHCQRKGMIL